MIKAWGTWKEYKLNPKRSITNSNL